MSGDILIKAVKDVACEEWGWVNGRVVSFFNLDVTQVAEFCSGVSARTLGLVAGAGESRDSNMITNKISKEPSNSIYIYHHLVTYMNDSEMINQKFLRPATIVPSYSKTYFTAEQSQIHQKWMPQRYGRCSIGRKRFRRQRNYMRVQNQCSTRSQMLQVEAKFHGVTSQTDKSRYLSILFIHAEILYQQRVA